jgi:uncharacterized protein YjeT (DUF2065 family)
MTINNPLSMELSLILAQVLGIVFFVLGFGLVCNAKRYKKMYQDLIKNDGFVFFAAVFALIVGTTLVLTHNIWETHWSVIITILGWIALLEGFILAVFPEQTVKMATGIINKKTMFIVAGIGYMVFGGVLIYFGFFHADHFLFTLTSEVSSRGINVPTNISSLL